MADLVDVGRCVQEVGVVTVNSGCGDNVLLMNQIS